MGLDILNAAQRKITRIQMKKFFLAVCISFCVVFAMLPSAAAQAMGRESEIRMGRETARQLEARYGLYDDEWATARVQEIGMKLVAETGEKDNYPWQFRILNTDEVNAVSCPGGFIYVYRGLLELMPSDAELAGVLGHEIGHVTRHHVAHQIEKTMWTSLVAVLAGAATGSPVGVGLASMAAQAMSAGYSRADERDADKVGLAYCVNAGLNPYGMFVTMHKLQDYAARRKVPDYGIFSSHPEPEERIRRIREQLSPLELSVKAEQSPDGGARVRDGVWTHSIPHGTGTYKPIYRAWILAGNLCCAKERGMLRSDRFIVSDNGNSATLYYDDIELLTLQAADVPPGSTLGEYANQIVSSLYVWAEQVNKKPLAEKPRLAIERSSEPEKPDPASTQGERKKVDASDSDKIAPKE